MADAAGLHIVRGGQETSSLSERLNSTWHRPALLSFMVIVFFHWAEHLVQAWQVWGLHMSRQMSMGILGMYYPWLMKSEVLHYSFALVMVVGIWVLRRGFTGRSRTWWMVCFWIQFWHHFEHLTLLIQAQTHHFWFGGTVPTSVGQIWVPRIELHLFYNAIVFIPMVVGMYYHMYPPAGEVPSIACACARHRGQVPARAAA